MTGFLFNPGKNGQVWKINFIISKSWKMLLHTNICAHRQWTVAWYVVIFAWAIKWQDPSHGSHPLSAELKEIYVLSKLWKIEMENIWLCCNVVGECDTLDSPWTIKCTNSPKDSQRPLPVNKLCLGPALSIRQQQQKAGDKRSPASFVVHSTSSRQPLLWAVM